MTKSSRYFIQPGTNLTDFSLDYAPEATLAGHTITVKGTSNVDYLFVSGAFHLDFSESLSGQDVVFVRGSRGAFTPSVVGGGDDANDLKIDASTGVISLKASPDYEAKSIYTFTVVATDQAGHASEQQVTLNVTNLDEVAPTFTSSATATVEENTSAEVVVYTAVANNNDTNDVVDASVSYSLKSVADEDASAFIINGSTGVVSIKSSPDYEDKSSYTFTVVATDQAGQTAEQTVTLNVTNVNEAPKASLDVPAFVFKTGQPANTKLGEYFTDEDSDDNLTYSLWNVDKTTAATLEHGLSFNAETGLISGTPTQAQETTTYVVRATDQGKLTAEKTITLGIIRIPIITPDNTDAYLNASETSIPLNVAYPFKTGGALKIKRKNSDGTYTDVSFKVGASAAATSYNFSADREALIVTVDKSELASGMVTDKPYVLRAVYTQGVEPVESIDFIVTVDSEAPSVPSISLHSDTGASGSDGVTFNGVINVTGVEANGTWQYKTSSAATAWTDGTGTSFTLPSGTFANGDIKVRQLDVAGNTSADQSFGKSLTVDTESPSVPSVALRSDTGVSRSDGVTYDGVINVTGVEDNGTWQYKTSSSAATWTEGTGTHFTLPAGTFASGDIQVRQLDVAGNTSSGQLLGQAITVDTGVPSLPSISLHSDTGASGSDGVTYNGVINVTGVEANGTWQYKTSSAATAWTDGTGTSFTLPSGTFANGDIKVRQLDVAGNTSADQLFGKTITVDTQNPSEPSVTLRSDTGASGSDGVTNDGVIIVSGVEQGASWQYKISSTAALWTEGTGSHFTLPAGTFASGDILVRQLDAAGNSSDVHSVSSVVVDKTNPTTGTLELVGFTDTGISDGITSDDTFVLGLTGQEDGAVFEYQQKSDGGPWTKLDSPSLTSLVEGSYQFRALVTDVAGNTAVTEAVSVRVDTSPPVAGKLSLLNFTDTGASDGKYTTDNTFDLSLAGQESGASVEYQQRFEEGFWTKPDSTNLTSLAEGRYEFRALVTDSAGNSDVTNVVNVVVDDTDPDFDRGDVIYWELYPPITAGLGLITPYVYVDPHQPHSVVISLDNSGNYQDVTLGEQTEEIGVDVRGNKVSVELILARPLMLGDTFEYKLIATDLAGNSGAQTFIYKVVPAPVIPG